MNTPNKLTFLRILLSFVCIGLIIKNSFASLLLAFLVFILASITDFLDGYLARKHNLISDLGKILDPLADKILIIGVFCAFLEIGVITTPVVVLIMFREFIITGLRLYGLNKGVVLEAKKWGKHKTFSQVVALIVTFFAVIFSKTCPGAGFVDFMYYQLVPWLMWYVVAITLFSGVYYFWVNRKTIITF
jgi:CDP-diacylglycerol---glycerol-3-phosphate 3-phosphatidyltransferase